MPIIPETPEQATERRVGEYYYYKDKFDKMEARIKELEEKVDRYYKALIREAGGEL